MSQFEEELTIRLRAIDDKSLKIKMKNLFNGRKAHKDTINELKNKKEFSGFLNNWKYEGSIIYNAKLWKKNENDFFNIKNSYFILNTEEELNTFIEFLEMECQGNKTELSSDEINGIYKDFLENYNPPDKKEKILHALEDVLVNKTEASHENIALLTKFVKTNVTKVQWYKKLNLTKDQVSVISQRINLCQELPEYKNIIMNLAVNKFKLIAHKELSKIVKTKIFEAIKENPRITKKGIESIIDSYRIFNESEIDCILNNLKTLWPTLDSKSKKEISSQLHKIKEKINYE